MTQSPGHRRLSRRRFIQLGAATGALGLTGVVGYGVENTRLPAPFPAADAVEPLATASPAPDAPILLALNTRSANPFGRYLGEILRAEGLNAFRVARLDALDSATLARFAVVLLSEGPLDADQAVLLERYVADGGNLVAMRPDPRLAALLGVSFTGGRTSDGYLRTVAGHSAAQGIATSTLQFHGEADHVRLAGAEPVAELYTAADTPGAAPLITINSAGKGKAVLWAFDLARSVALMRQGNPAWANQERDGLDTIRACDMFVGWVDLDRIAIPQADEQQRLLANILHELSATSGPLPRLWYFPTDSTTLLVLTGDAHGIDAPFIADILGRVERYSGHMSVYYTPPPIGAASRVLRRARWWAAGLPVVGGLVGVGALPTPAHVAAWRAHGHEFGLHPYIEEGLEAGYNSYWNLFEKFGYGPVSPTTRTHRVLWHGWVENARIQARYGIQMNLDYYHVGQGFRKPNGEWAYGHFTGSGLPMKFVDEAGTILNVYQQNTQLVDERLLDVFGGKLDGLSAEAAVAVSKQLIQGGLRDYPAAIGMQCHFDPFQIGGPRALTIGRWLEGTLEYAASQSVPVVSAQQWVEFTAARDATQMRDLQWDAGAGRMSFGISVPGSAASPLGVLIPLRHAGRRLGEVQVDGNQVAYTERAVGSVSYAAVRVAGGDHVIQGRFTA